MHAPLALLFAASALAGPVIEQRQATLSLDEFIAQERRIAVAGVLANIGPNGASAQNASRGVVIAGPGIVNPDYRYTWTRDSAMTIHAINEEFFVGNASLQSTIEDYIYAEAIRQTVNTPLGDLYPWGTGLGEPKYQINLTRFHGVWGRPQPDGPALRAITLMGYIDYLLDNGQMAQAKEEIWPIVQNDLNYVSQYWSIISYDLWEEVAGNSFFTIQSMHHSLVEGAHMAVRLGYTCPQCESQAPQVACFLANNFWNETGQHVLANINTPEGFSRTGIDSNYLLGAAENFDIDAPCDNTYYQPCSSRILASHKAYVDSFREIYPINAGRPANGAVATGRYPEDVYYGGNPWYIGTLNAAEVLYDAAAQFRRQGQLTIDSTSLPFFQQFYPSAAVGTYHAPRGWWQRYSWGWSSWGERTWGKASWWGPGKGYGRGRNGNQRGSAFTDILDSMTNYADGFVSVVREYTPANGSYSEQFNRTTGEMLSAYDLTWSLAAFVTMTQRRNGQYPASWGLRDAAPLPSSCNTAGAGPQNYAPAIEAGAPPVDMSCVVQITFRVNATTTFGTNIYVSGNISDLGNWAPDYEPMTPPRYPIWEAIVEAPPNTVVSYAYVQQNPANYTFEVGNRTITTPDCGNGRVQLSTLDAIRGPGTVITENYCNPDVTRCW
ncbi:hypothetical protein H2201_006468 [Coniosporium apollinis]|uniref:Glucoamylase n=1 Tax=Coniosporium apollinis TaxID=61459 RepID=A0ABQ9NMQ3_9PEZI|nr:hypothetical protein H2201_006468 [Coniosporium apollinis]